MSSTADKSDNVRAVGRALDILLAFTPQDSELTVSELLKRVDLSRPTLYRLLYTLEERGFITSLGDPQRFRLGPSVGKLAFVWTSTLSLANLAEPTLRKIWTSTQETVALFVPHGALRLCIAELPSPQPLNFKRGVGYTERIDIGATGRAILAFLPEFPPELDAPISQARIDLTQLQSQLQAVKEAGFATSRNELINGAVAIAVPFFDRQGVVSGSIGVFGPEVRINTTRQKEIAQLLMQEAKALSKNLGYFG